MGFPDCRHPCGITRGINELSSPYRYRQHATAQVAWDMYQVLRHRLAWDDAIAEGIVSESGQRTPTMLGVRYDEPLRMSAEPLALIVRNEQ